MKAGLAARRGRPASCVTSPRTGQLLAFRWRRLVRFALVPDVSAAADPDVARELLLADVPELPDVPDVDPEFELGLLPVDRLELSALALREVEPPVEVERPRDVPAWPCPDVASDIR